MARVAATNRPTITNIGSFISTNVSPDTDCHQGVAVDANYVYTFDTTAIYKLNPSTYAVVQSNTNAATNASVTHLGDGQVYNGVLYIAAENFIDDTHDATSKRIAMYNTSDLSYIGNFPVTEMDEIASVCVDASTIYAVSYNTGGKIFKYARSNGAYQGYIPVNLVMKRMQGITLGGGHFWMGRGISNILYKVSMTGIVVDSMPLYSDVSGGELEGIDFTTGTLYVLHDNGTPEVVETFTLQQRGRRTLTPRANSLLFNASTTIITLTQGSGLPLYRTTGYSVVGWIWARQKGSSAIIFGEGNTGSNNQFLLIDVLATNKMRVRINNDLNATLVNVTSDITFPRNRYIPFVWSDNNGDAFLMVDGKLGAQSFDYTTSGTVTLNKSAIGALPQASNTSFYAGALSDVRLYGRAVTVQEALTISTQTTPADIRNYVLAEGTGSTATDTSTNASNATISNGTWTTTVPYKTRTTATNRVPA